MGMLYIFNFHVLNFWAIIMVKSAQNIKIIIVNTILTMLASSQGLPTMFND